MTGNAHANRYYIGWDVGGWNCDQNPRSRDAIVILDAKLIIVGTPWRGNLRQAINEAGNTEEWIRTLFRLCSHKLAEHASDVTLAIDTPLGFSTEFIALVTGLKHVQTLEQFNTNQYLYRQTERYLFERGHNPLSPIKDMIGSQATKGMHVLAKFAPTAVACGVWSDGKMLTAIEAYPSVCQESATIAALRRDFSALKHEDEKDAYTCALIAYLFAEDRGKFDAPDVSVPKREGWIWVPKDAVKYQ